MRHVSRRISSSEGARYRPQDRVQAEKEQLCLGSYSYNACTPSPCLALFSQSMEECRNIYISEDVYTNVHFFPTQIPNVNFFAILLRMKLFRTVLVTVLSVKLYLARPIPVKNQLSCRDAGQPSGNAEPDDLVANYASSSYPVLSQKWATFSSARAGQSSKSSSTLAPPFEYYRRPLDSTMHSTPFGFIPIRQLMPSIIAEMDVPASSEMTSHSFGHCQVDSPLPLMMPCESNKPAQIKEEREELPYQSVSNSRPRAPTNYIAPKRNIKGKAIKRHALHRKAP